MKYSGAAHILSIICCPFLTNIMMQPSTFRKQSHENHTRFQYIPQEIYVRTTCIFRRIELCYTYKIYPVPNFPATELSP